MTPSGTSYGWSIQVFSSGGIKVESPMGGEDKKAEIHEDDGKICKDFKLRSDMAEFLPSRLFWWFYGRMTWKVGTEERDLERDQQLVMRIQISVNAYREH